VKRKISAIFLLISFLGILTHDLIPHHHYDGKESIVKLVHSHADADNQDEENICSPSESLNADGHQQCAHHLHKCPSKDFELSKNRSTSRTSKTKVHNSIFSSAFFFLAEIESKESEIFFLQKHLLPNSQVCGTNSLRAPPSFV
jgi:hypothetical protein